MISERKDNVKIARCSKVVVLSFFVACVLSAHGAVVQAQLKQVVAPQRELNPAGDPGVRTGRGLKQVVAPQRELKATNQGTVAIRARLDPVNSKFSGVHAKMSAKLDKINSSRLITEQDLVEDAEFDTEMMAYANGMKAAFDQALQEAEAASKSEGREGNSVSLKAFEEMAKVHESKFKAMEARQSKLELKIKDGTITLDKSVIQKSSPVQLREFRDFLSPQGLQKNYWIHPQLKQLGMNMPLDYLRDAGFVDQAKEIYYAIPGALSAFLVAPAEASLAWGCVSPCWNRNWSECSQCIARVAPGAGPIWNQFVSCWSGSGKAWYTPWFWHRAGCLFTFVYKLA